MKMNIHRCSKVSQQLFCQLHYHAIQAYSFFQALVWTIQPTYHCNSFVVTEGVRQSVFEETENHPLSYICANVCISAVYLPFA